MTLEPPEGFEPCSPCSNIHKEAQGVPSPHWWIMRVDGKIVGSCKQSWGFASCPSSPRNAEVQAMTKEEQDAWGARLFPLMDVARHFATVFEWDYHDAWK